MQLRELVLRWRRQEADEDQLAADYDVTVELVRRAVAGELQAGGQPFAAIRDPRDNDADDELGPPRRGPGRPRKDETVVA